MNSGFGGGVFGVWWKLETDWPAWPSFCQPGKALKQASFFCVFFHFIFVACFACCVFVSTPFSFFPVHSTDCAFPCRIGGTVHSFGGTIPIPISVMFVWNGGECAGVFHGQQGQHGQAGGGGLLPLGRSVVPAGAAPAPAGHGGAAPARGYHSNRNFYSGAGGRRRGFRRNQFYGRNGGRFGQHLGDAPWDHNGADSKFVVIDRGDLNNRASGARPARGAQPDENDDPQGKQNTSSNASTDLEAITLATRLVHPRKSRRDEAALAMEERRTQHQTQAQSKTQTRVHGEHAYVSTPQVMPYVAPLPWHGQGRAVDFTVTEADGAGFRFSVTPTLAQHHLASRMVMPSPTPSPSRWAPRRATVEDLDMAILCTPEAFCAPYPSLQIEELDMTLDVP